MKVFFDIARLLPDLPSGEDACAQRLAGSLRRREGIRRVHLTDEGGAQVVCVHYAKPETSRARIIEIVQTLAAQLARSIGHARWDAGGRLSAPRLREAVRLLEDQKGVLEAHADTARYLCAEYLRDRTGLSALQEALRDAGIQARALVAKPAAPGVAARGNAAENDERPSEDEE